MLNYIWLGLVVLAVVIGGCNDHLSEVTKEGFEMAKAAVMEIALPLAGIMALWLGVMRVAERAGLIALLARALRPLMLWLFPDVPADHPAMGSMLVNIAASVLGLGNAATPLGLRAMKDLETLNRNPGTATNPMCTFLAINTGSVQLIPATAIAILAANHSSNPTAIVGTSILATACAVVAAVTAAKLLQRLPVFRLPPPVRLASGSLSAKLPAPGDVGVVKEAPALQPLRWWGVILLAGLLVFFGWLWVRLTLTSWSGRAAGFDSGFGGLFISVVDSLSKLSIPFLLSAFPLFAALRRVKVYEEFVDGAKEGFEVAIRIIPYLVAILVAVGMFRAAGGIDLLSNALSPIMRVLSCPPELLPMILMRPLSGSGTLGIFAELVKHYGADSLISRTAGTIYGSTETTFYVLAVYFGSVAIKKTRYAVLAGLFADLVGVTASVIVCRAVFG